MGNKEYIRAGIYEEYLQLSLQSYHGNVPEDAYWVVQKYTANIKDMKSKGLGVFFHGSQGTGKTGLMMEILKSSVDAGFTTQFGSLGGIIQKFSDSWYSAEARQEFFEYVRKVTFLGIDDVGKELETKNGLEIVVFDNVIRYRSMRMLPTVFTANIHLKDMGKRYSEYIVSLMKGNSIPVKMSGKDFRAEIAQKNIQAFMEGYSS